MKKEIRFAFFVLGVTSVTAQVMILREFIASFYGNEFFLGWLLFAWLFWTAAGSGLAGKRTRPPVLASGFVLMAAACFSGIILIRFSRSVLGIVPGALPDLLPALLYSFATIGPVCFLLGMQFSGLAKMSVGTEEPDAGGVLGRGYLFESLGFMAGGILFSLFFVRLNVFYAMSVIAALNFGTAAMLAFPGNIKKTAVAFLMALAAVTVMGLFADRLDLATAALRFPSEKLEITRNTVHGNISVTSSGAQRNFYQNGALTGADREDLASELLVHFPLLAHPSPGRVLIFGTGFNGPVREALKHRPREIVSVDIDPELVRIAKGRLPRDLEKSLEDPAVLLASGDPRAYLSSVRGTGDVVLLNFPDPSSVLVNRNFTLEFFRSVRDRLAPDGIFALKLDFAPNYISRELERLGSSVYATLRQVFPSVVVLPEDTAYFLASPREGWVPDADDMAERFMARGLRTEFVTPSLVRDRLTNDRVQQVVTIFRNSVYKVKNTDFRPRACYFALMRWLSRFRPAASQALLRVSDLPFGLVAAVFLILFHLPFAGGSDDPAQRYRKLGCRAMSVTGFSVMAFEVTLIYLFQVAFGDLYYRIAWLIAAFMAGTGLGAFLAIRMPSVLSRRWVAFLHLAAVIFYGALAFAVHRISGPGSFFEFAHGTVFYALALLSGGLAGLEFPCACRLYLGEGSGEGLGKIYAADLLGSCLGALLTAGFLIPVWGLPRTLMLIALLNSLVLLFFPFGKDLRRKNI